MQKVPILMKTTGLCLSRSYYSITGPDTIHYTVHRLSEADVTCLFFHRDFSITVPWQFALNCSYKKISSLVLCARYLNYSTTLQYVLYYNGIYFDYYLVNPGVDVTVRVDP